MLRIDVVPPRSDSPTLARFDACHASVLEYAAATVFYRGREANEILRGVELRLIWKAQCTGGGERQRSRSEHLCLQAEASRRRGLGFDTRPAHCFAGVRVRVFAFKIARDMGVADPLADPRDSGLVGVRIQAGEVNTEFPDQMAVDKRVLARYFCCRATGDLASDLSRFQYRH